MLRPTWIGVLVLFLAVAWVFGALAQWQLSRAIQLDTSHVVDSETVVPITEVEVPGEPVTEDRAGRMVTVRGAFVDGDYTIVSERPNYGEIGSWVVGHFVAPLPPAEGGGAAADAPPAHYAVAIGWAPDDTQAAAARERLTGEQADADARATLTSIHTLTGRFTPTESPLLPRPDWDPLRQLSMVPGQVANDWEPPVMGPISAGYVVADIDDAFLAGVGLEAIESVPPSPPETVNWLNLFYAVEWVIFAGFALYLWSRLARDAWEREHEQRLQDREDQRFAELAAAQSATPRPQTPLELPKRDTPERTSP